MESFLEAEFWGLSKDFLFLAQILCGDYMQEKGVCVAGTMMEMLTSLRHNESPQSVTK